MHYGVRYAYGLSLSRGDHEDERAVQDQEHHSAWIKIIGIVAYISVVWAARWENEKQHQQLELPRRDDATSIVVDDPAATRTRQRAGAAGASSRAHYKGCMTDSSERRR